MCRNVAAIHARIWVIVWTETTPTPVSVNSAGRASTVNCVSYQGSQLYQCRVETFFDHHKG